MDFDFSGPQPLFVQVADQLRAGIASGALPEGEQVPSTTEISRTYTINPATVLKGMTMLVDEGLLEKRRGLGMFVVPGPWSGCAARNGSDLSAIASPTWWRRRGDWESVARSLSG